MFKFLSTESRPSELLDYIVRMGYIAELNEWDNRPHIERIRRYCYILASGLDIAQRDVEIMSIASQLHDVGKIAIPVELLTRKGDYTRQEWAVMEKHTSEGAQILKGSSSPVLQIAETIALSHHERWDGSGYPQGLKGDKIPMSGRICALADVFDALTSNRVYKNAIDDIDALSLIRKSSGTLFDPRLIKIFDAKMDEILKTKNALNLP